MPIYEYRCDSCGQELEKIQKVSDPPLRDCPACGKPTLSKLISAAGFRLKGSGWYETDFKTGRKKNVLGEGKGGDSGSAKADAGKAEAGKESPKSNDSKPADKSSAAAG